MIYELYWIELAIYIGALYKELFAVIRQYVYDTHKYLALLNTAHLTSQSTLRGEVSNQTINAPGGRW